MIACALFGMTQNSNKPNFFDVVRKSTCPIVSYPVVAL